MNEYHYKNFYFKNLNYRSILYKDGWILFMGNSWSGILEFLRVTDNAPEVQVMFKQQLQQREQPGPRFSNEAKQQK
jgi:hypothetical protein